MFRPIFALVALSLGAPSPASAPNVPKSRPTVTGAESPTPPGKVTLLNMRSVVAALQKEGYRAKLVTEGDKVHIESADNGANFYIYPQNCSKGPCQDLLFRSSYTKHKEKPVTIEEINAFNRDQRWVRSYLDKEGDPVIEMDVLFTDQLIDENMFGEAIEIWSDQVGQFHKAIRY